MTFFAQFIAVGIVGLLACISPGPDFFIVSKNSISHSFKAGFGSTIGVVLGCLLHSTYCIIGIGVIITQSILLYSAIKYLGAAYLIYLGIQSIRSKSTPQELEIESTTNKLGFLGGLKQGFFTNALNPKATVFFLSLFTQVIDPHTPKAIQALMALEVGIIATAWFTFVAYIFSREKLRGVISKTQSHVNKVLGGILILLGLKIVSEKG